MGYYARGNGNVTFKENVVLEDVKKAITENGFEDEFEYDIDKDGIYFCSNDKYHEEDVTEALNILTPYIKEGTVNFVGEDDTLWQLLFIPEKGEWKELNGTVVYYEYDFTEGKKITCYGDEINNILNYLPAEKLAEVLREKGYTVTKGE